MVAEDGSLQGVGSGVGLEVPRDVQAGLHTSVWEGQEG